MLRSLAVAPGRLLLRHSIVGLALAFAGCSSSPGPAPISVEQAAPDGPGSAAIDSPSRQQHLERLGVPPWHEKGYRGQGVRVAILDSGFRGYRGFLGKGLPRSVKTALLPHRRGPRSPR